MRVGTISDVRDLQTVPGVELCLCSAACGGSNVVTGVIGTGVGDEMTVGILEEAAALPTAL